MASTQLLLALLLSILTLVKSSPVAASPIVIPGPGLPSLESLGLTSEDLFNMPLIRTSVPSQSSNVNASSKATADFTAAPGFDSICLDQASYGAPPSAIQGCLNYLDTAKASANCVVAGPNLYKEVFCTSSANGDAGPFAMIVGQNIGSAPGGTSSRWYGLLRLDWRNSVGRKMLTLHSDYVAFAVRWALNNCTKAVPSLNNALYASGKSYFTSLVESMN